MSIAPEDLSQITNRESLFAFLQNKLSWPLDPEDSYAYNEQEVAGRASARAQVSRLVPFTESDPFAIFLVEFETAFRRTDLRDILRRILENIRKRAAYNNAALESLVFVCSTEDYTGIRFCHFEEREKRQPRLRSFGFERESVGETRTLRDTNLPALRVAANLYGEIDWNACRKSWLSAWDVEAVTKIFFKDYKRVFDEVEAQITGVLGGTEGKRLFVQRLFNRLMFIHFLSKKGWLEAPNGKKDYLHALWESRKAENNFYRTYLSTLFFTGLRNKDGYDLTVGVGPLIGKVPFLNGGLFEPTTDDQKGEVVPDEAIASVLALFARYRFTITESTPDDQEVAVDPEMLGKVFEELVTGRHESGSYYTPRPIVAFMCREALKGYLVPICGTEAAAALVDHHQGKAVSDPEAVLKALQNVRVVDPACGSGAYLLGMLHELIAVRHALFTARRVDPLTDYKRKLEIIQKCLYGVDMDTFAVETARLRLWLSLSVDFEGDKPEPLPNLDFKIEQGDSLLGPTPQTAADQTANMLRDMAIATFEEKKADFANPYWSGNKSVLKSEIEALSKEIRLASDRSIESTGFDWRVEFAEAFREGGFDIVLANPPYVRQELITTIKPALKTLYPTVYKGTADLYCYFYARSVELLRQGGMLAFISPNKWFKATYGAPLRKHLAETCRIESITDFGDLPVFESATAYPMIFVAQKGNPGGTTLLTEPKTLEPPYPDVRSLLDDLGQLLPAEAINGTDWNLTDTKTSARRIQMKSAGIPLGEYIKGKIYRGVLTGFNQAFVIDGAKRAELIAADPNSAEIIKSLAVGKDIRRWQINQRDTWLIVTKIGVDIKRYPAIFKHLQNWQSELESRWDKGDHWWELRACGYYEYFEKPKIVYQEIATYQSFAYDTNDLFFNNKVFMIITDDLFLLGLLNSRPVWAFLENTCTKLQGGALQMQTPYIEQIPVPSLPENQKKLISNIVKANCFLANPMLKEYSYIQKFFDRLLDFLFMEIFFPDVSQDKTMSIVNLYIENPIIDIDTTENEVLQSIIEYHDSIDSNHPLYSALFRISSMSISMQSNI